MDWKKFFLEELPNNSNPKSCLSFALLESKLDGILSDLVLTGEPHFFNKWHQETLWDHLTDCYKNGLAYTQDPVFAMACLFHDIGKVKTCKYDPAKQDYTFYKHEYVGAIAVAGWMWCHGFDMYDSNRVSEAIRHHQYRVFSQSQDSQGHVQHGTKDTAISKWLSKIGQQTWQDIRILRLVDRMANKANEHKPVIYEKYIEIDNRINSIAEKVFNESR